MQAASPGLGRGGGVDQRHRSTESRGSHGARGKVRVLVLDFPVQGDALSLEVVSQQGQQGQRRGQGAVWWYLFPAGRDTESRFSWLLLQP